MKPRETRAWVHQVTLWRILAVPGSTPAKALASVQPTKDQTSQEGWVTWIRSASMMKPVTMIPRSSSRTIASSGVLSGFP